MASIAASRNGQTEQSTTMSVDQQATIRMLANDLHRLNQSVMKAVEAASRWSSCARRGTMAAMAIGAIC